MIFRYTIDAKPQGTFDIHLKTRYVGLGRARVVRTEAKPNKDLQETFLTKVCICKIHRLKRIVILED